MSPGAPILTCGKADRSSRDKLFFLPLLLCILSKKAYQCDLYDSYDSLWLMWLDMTHMTHCDSYDSLWLIWLIWLPMTNYDSYDSLWFMTHYDSWLTMTRMTHYDSYVSCDSLWLIYMTHYDICTYNERISLLLTVQLQIFDFPLGCVSVLESPETTPLPFLMDSELHVDPNFRSFRALIRISNANFV